MTTEVINPDGFEDTTKRSYSRARIDNDVLYISGLVGSDVGHEPVRPDITSQSEQIFKNLKQILAEVGLTLADVPKVTTYLVNAQKDYDEYKQVWSEYFTDEPYPCHTLIGVDELARESYLVEVDVNISLK